MPHCNWGQTLLRNRREWRWRLLDKWALYKQKDNWSHQRSPNRKRPQSDRVGLINTQSHNREQCLPTGRRLRPLRSFLTLGHSTSQLSFQPKKCLPVLRPRETDFQPETDFQTFVIFAVHNFPNKHSKDTQWFYKFTSQWPHNSRTVLWSRFHLSSSCFPLLLML